MQKVLVVGAAAGAAIAITVLVIILQTPSEKYSIFLDPFIDPQTLVTNSHVTVQNTGREPLTNVKVDYGAGSKPDILPVLNPGEKVILSPPSDNPLQYVTVTTDQGISVTKEYRSAPKMVGMMGS